jgi:hypothetical protein
MYLLNISENMDKKKAFVFTSDALVTIPITILLLTTFLAFSVLLREDLFMYEYIYTVAKDQINYLNDIPCRYADRNCDPKLSILQQVSMYLKNGDKDKAANLINKSISISEDFGYVVEYYDGKNWVEILNKEKPNPKFTASSIKITVDMTNPKINIGGKEIDAIYPNYEYLQNYSCRESIACSIPTVSLYEKGEVVGPYMFRIRVQK